MPPFVADQLRQKKPVVAQKYEVVTLLFVGIWQFEQFCARNSLNAWRIVNLLNKLYTLFDEVVDQATNVYKVCENQ